MDITNKEIINRMKELKEKDKNGCKLSISEKKQLGAWLRYSDESYIYDYCTEKKNDKLLILFGDCEKVNLFGENWRTYTLSEHLK